MRDWKGQIGNVEVNNKSESKEMEPFTYQVANPPRTADPEENLEKRMKTSHRSSMFHRLVVEEAGRARERM